MRWLKNFLEQEDPEQVLLKKIESHYHNNQGFYIAKAARMQMKLDPYTFVYGEITSHAMHQLLQYIEPQLGDVFYDLGSGSGKAAMTAALCYPELLVKGIEYLETMHQLSIDLSDTLFENLSLAKQQIQFVHADLHDYSLSDGTIIFINATGYFDLMYQKLVETLKQLKQGARVIIASKKLPESHFELLAEFPEVKMNWGYSKVTIYAKAC